MPVSARPISPRASGSSRPVEVVARATVLGWSHGPRFEEARGDPHSDRAARRDRRPARNFRRSHQGESRGPDPCGGHVARHRHPRTVGHFPARGRARIYRDDRLHRGHAHLRRHGFEPDHVHWRRLDDRTAVHGGALEDRTAELVAVLRIGRRDRCRDRPARARHRALEVGLARGLPLVADRAWFHERHWDHHHRAPVTACARSVVGGRFGHPAS